MQRKMMKFDVDWFMVFEESMICKEYEYRVRKHDLQRIGVWSLNCKV
jgi:hypothetical protein